MRLYTSLVRLKLSMNDGRLPPMTPVPPEARDVIDPKFTIGLGALTEVEGLGLRCPIRGCGKWFQRLGMHIARAHPSTSVREVRQKLSIPQSARLVSQSYRDRAAAAAVVSLGLATRGAERAAHARACRKAGASRRAAPMTIGAKNLRDSCPTQLSHKIIDLHHRIGRTPTWREAGMAYGEAFPAAVVAVYGTWNNAINQCGLVARRSTRRYDTADVLEALSAYYAAHGALPSNTVALKGRTLPILPTPRAIMKAFNTESYPAAMRMAASLLDIHGGRYGLPEPLAQSA